MASFPYRTVCEIAFQSPGATPTWVDMSSRLIAFDTNVGQQYDYDGPQPGGCSVRLDNSDGALDPENASGPYAGTIRANRRVRLSAQITSGSPLVYLATGYTNSWVRSFPGGARVSETVISCTDQCKFFPRQNVVGVGIGAGYNARDHMYTVSGCATPGSYNGLAMSSATYNNVNRWDMINDIAIADGGLFYVDGNDTPTYLTSGYRDTATNATTVQETFAFGVSTGTEITDDSMTPILEDRLLANMITVFDSALAAHTSNDAASRAAHGDIPFQINSGLTAAAAQTRADYLKLLRATERQRFDSLTIDALTGDQQMNDAMYLLMGDRVRLNYRGLGDPAASSRDYWLHGISHSVDFQNPKWLTSYQLQATTS